MFGLAERLQIDNVGERDEGLAAGLVILAGQPTKPMRVIGEMDADAALAAGNRLFAARAPRSTRLLAAECSVKRHHTSPEQPPSLGQSCMSRRSIQGQIGRSPINARESGRAPAREISYG
jgi:hypothetical protein